MTAQEELGKDNLSDINEPQDLELTCCGCGTSLTRENLVWCEVQGQYCQVAYCRGCCTMASGRWTCYMCAGAYENVKEDPMKYRIEHKLKRSNDVFYGDSCSETESMWSDDWDLSQSFSDYERERTQEEKPGLLKFNSAVPEEQRDLTHLPPLPFRGRLPTGEDSGSEFSV